MTHDALALAGLPGSRRSSWPDLLRRDLALQPRPLMKTLFAGLFLGQLLGLWTRVEVSYHHLPPFAAGSLQAVLALTVAWAVVAAMLALGRVSLRAGPLELALPIPARQVWLVRTVALALIGLAILAAAAVAAELAALPLGMHPWEYPRLRALLLRTAALILPFIALMHARFPHLAELPRSLASLRHGLIVFLALLGAALILDHLPAILTVALPVAGLLLLCWTARRLPATFSLVPDEASGESAGMPASRTGEASGGLVVRGSAAAGLAEWGAVMTAAGPVGRRNGRIVIRTVLRNLYPSFDRMGVTVVFYPVVALYAYLMANANVFGIIAVTWLWAFLIQLTISPLSTLHRLDPLPISRRLILPVMLLPGLLVASLTYGIARSVRMARAEADGLVQCPTVERQDGSTYCSVYVPWCYFETARDGKAPLIRAPWDESHEAWHMALFKGSSLVLYSPFSVQPESSPRFIAHQLSRAIAAIYGREIAPEELQKRYLVEGQDGRAALAPGGFALLRDYPDLQPPRRTPVVPLMIALIGCPWLLMMAALFRPLARVAHDAARPWLFPLIVAPPLAILVLFVAGDMAGWIDPRAGNALVEIFARRVGDALPGGSAMLWGLTLLLLAGSYLLAQGGFRHVEAPVGTPQR
jgi:hypothetical protein